MQYLKLNPEVTVDEIIEALNLTDTAAVRDNIQNLFSPNRMVNDYGYDVYSFNGYRIPTRFLIPAYRMYYYYGVEGTEFFVDTAGEKTWSYNIEGMQVHECSKEQYENYVPTFRNYRFKSLDEYDLKTDIPVELEHLLTYETVISLNSDTVKGELILLLDKYKVHTSDLERVPENEKEDLRNPPVQWSEPTVTKVGVNTNALKEQIRVRYAMFDRPRNGLSNVVLDSFVPRLLYKANFNIEKLHDIIDIPKTSVVISPWFASLLGVKQIPTEQLCRILGYSLKDIKTLITSVKRKELTLNLVGFGGTSINTVHWLHSMMEMTNTLNLFRQVNIWEPDAVEGSNLLRFPINPQVNSNTYIPPVDIMKQIQKVSKTDLLNGELFRLSKNKPIINKLYFKVQTYNEYPYRTDYTKEIYSTVIKDSSQIIYGAPDIATREILSEYGNFISATHSNTTCRIDLNPKQDTNLQVESYGVISLAMFFMNQLKMSISFLELLASDQDLQEQDKTILEYSFNGRKLMATDREYNFQLEHSGLVFTEEEAEANV